MNSHDLMISFNRNGCLQHEKIQQKTQHSADQLNNLCKQFQDQKARQPKICKYKVKAIEIDQNSEEQNDQIMKQSIIQNEIGLLQVCLIKPELINFERPIEDTISVKRPRKRKRLQLRKQKKKKSYQINWQIPKLSNTRYLDLNRRYKGESYLQIKNYLRMIYNHKTQKRILIIGGKPQSGKKSILFDALKQVSQQFQDLEVKYFYIEMKGLQNRQLKEKIKALCYHLYEIDRSDSQNWNIFIIGSFQRLLEGKIYCSDLQELKNRIRRNKKVIIAGVDNTISRKIFKSRMLGLGVSFTVKLNTKQYFMESLIQKIMDTSISQSCNMEITKPLANYFSSRMEAANLLSLYYVHHFARFAKQQILSNEINVGPSIRISRQIFQKYLQKLLESKKKIDICKLQLHEKVFLIGCYLILKEDSGVLTECSQVFAKYCWVCEGLNFKPKSENDYGEIVNQVQTYGLVTLRRKKRNGLRERKLFLNMDLLQIKWAFQKEHIFSFFFDD